MRLFTVYHNLPEGYECTCVSDVFPAWRVRIMRIDGGCECDFFCKVDGLCDCAFFRWSDGSCDCCCRADGECDLVSRGSGWKKVSKERMDEALLDSMLKSDEWRMGGFFECRKGNGKG